MATFTIGDYDFGVDADASHVEISSDKIDITIVGCKELVESLWDDDDHPWSWLVYPPKIYLTDVPVNLDGDGFQRDITEDDFDEYDIAIYVMKHCDILPCRVTLRDGLLMIRGKVHEIAKQPYDFHVEFAVTSA